MAAVTRFPAIYAHCCEPDGVSAGAHEGLRAILRQRNLTALFQPIMGLSNGKIVGFEGLIRGPASSSLHFPADIFEAARRHKLTLEIEMLCRQVVLAAFAQQKLPGRLFLNVSPSVLTHPSFKNGQTLRYMRQLGIAPDQVTIEITENQPTADIKAMRDAALHYRSMGFKIALDDLGEGFSSLRLWSELHPEFVKIDKHFIRDVNSDPLKRQFLKSFQQIAERSHCQIIAEGIETEAELIAVKNLGIALGQGYFIAHPTQTLPISALQQASRAIIGESSTLFPGSNSMTHDCNATAQQLLVYIEPAAPETENNEILSRFSTDPALPCIPVVDHGRPVCLINRHDFMDRFAQPFQRKLLGNKPCIRAMHDQPLLIEKGTPIQEISQFLTETRNRHFADGFIVTEEGRYLGIGTWQDLLRIITRMQAEAARHADPLTLLPGNVPINEQIKRLLQAGASFHACYGDLDNFKRFNDIFGYQWGDELIQLTARILRGACDPACDFIGHVGGDDFILLMQSQDWENRCDNALRLFAEASISLVKEHRRVNGGYESEARHGRLAFRPLPTLSIGAVQVVPDQFHSHVKVSEAAAEAKKTAKSFAGNSLFVARSQAGIRQQGPATANIADGHAPDYLKESA
jgi:diguanylate cyclase (GGDEF)-like protein